MTENEIKLKVNVCKTCKKEFFSNGENCPKCQENIKIYKIRND